MAAPTFNTYYTHYSDEVARLADSIEIESDASPSLAGGDDYAPTSLIDDDPGKVAKINETDTGSPASGLVTGAWKFTYGSKQPIAFAALIHTTADETVDNPGSPAPSVRLEGNDSGVFGDPDFSAEFTLPPWLGAGTSRWPQNPWMNLTEQEGYDAAGFLYWWLIFENQSQNIQVGEVRFHPVIRQFDPDLRWGLSFGIDAPQIDNETSFGVETTYPRNAPRWRQDAEIILTDDMREQLEQHQYDVGFRSRPWVIVPSGPGNTDRCYLVKYTTPLEQQWNSHDLSRQRLTFQEVGRGLRPGV